MRAARFHRFGGPDVLSVEEVPDPDPDPGQVLVRVRAAALNPKDVLVRSGKFRWLGGSRFPKGTGLDFAGEVVKAGAGVADPSLAPGRRVFGMLNGWDARTCAEQVVVPQDELAPIADGLDVEAVAGVPLAGLTALQALRDDVRLGAGERLMVNGASGGVGTLAVQIGRILGARVTGVSSARNAALVQDLGADEVVDYRTEDPLAGPRGPFDVVFDVFGNRTFRDARRVLSSRGRYVTTVPSPRILWDTAWTRLRPGPTAQLVVVRSRRRDLAKLAGWLEAGTLRPVVDRVMPLDDIVQAHTHLGTRRARGKVIIRP
ncbi:MAG TPA: NAD(P)-dependent alcohol dehydrogenase [Polyangiaceae bacterium LLY-WYZ-14_1]|nr:NAD(P)-dependent alcohol dehydrogenase [Polyangiaceae bacterium LLY-WYZ-14_1]